MQRVAITLTLLAGFSAWASAASTVVVLPKGTRDYGDAVRECREATMSGNPLTDAQLQVCERVGESINKKGTVVIDSFKAERFMIDELEHRDGFSCGGSVYGMQQALYRTGNTTDDPEKASEMARTYVAGAAIVADNRFNFASLGTKVAGLYQYNACVQDAKSDPERAIFISAELRDRVCRSCQYGGDRLCAATYTHEAAHHLGRLTHETTQDKIEIETYAFYRECLYATEAFGGKAANVSADGELTKSGLHAWQAIYKNMVGSGSDDVVRLYADHLKDIMMTGCDKTQLRRMVENLYGNLPAQTCKAPNKPQPI